MKEKKKKRLCYAQAKNEKKKKKKSEAHKIKTCICHLPCILRCRANEIAVLPAGTYDQDA